MTDSEKYYVVMESTYTVENHQPIVILFSRNYNDPTESVTHRFTGFEPYFYVPAKIPSGISSNLIKRIEDDIHIDALGREIRKVVTYLPSDVPKVRDLFEWTDMADFVFDKRFLVDKHIKYAYKVVDGEPVPVDVPNAMLPRVTYCDIEVVSPPGIFPDPKVAAFPIITIQVMDSITKKIAVFTSDVVPQTDDETHYVCKDEKDLIKTFCLYIKHNDPDNIAFWNGDQFDIPYLIQRSKVIGVSLHGFSRQGEAKYDIDPRNGRFRVRVGGRATLDMLEAFKKYNIGRAQRESNGLKSVIGDKDLLGDNAFEYDDFGPIMEKVINEGRFSELIDYCKNDVIALQTIDETLGLYKFFETTRFLAGSKIMDGLFNTRILEMAFLHEGMRAMPTKTYGNKGDEKYIGAFVYEPIPGIHKLTGTLDIASLYPTIICSFNVSIDIDNISVNVTKKFMQLREQYRAEKKQGLLGAAEKDASMKSIVNSIYGFYGDKNGRMFNKEKAEFITLTGQEINKFLQQCCLEIGKEVVYCDTDSLFIKEINSVDELTSIEKLMNENLVKWTTSHNGVVPITLKAEKYFERLLFKYKSTEKKAGKKAYAGKLIWNEGQYVSKLSFMGIAVKRSDSSNISKDCLYNFLYKILMEEDTHGAIQYIKKLYKGILNGEANILDISLPKSVRGLDYTKSNSWVNGIAYGRKEYNYIIGEGIKPRLVYLKNNGVICIDEEFDTSLIKNDVDWKKMADKCIKRKLESYLWSLNMEWNSMIEGQNTLEAWF